MSNVKASLESNIVTVRDIQRAINRIGGYGSTFVPEFTFGKMRIDGILVDPRIRKIRGFEIKVSRADFLQDAKWQSYSRFCSSLSVACPEGLIKPEEIEAPFGLMWVKKENWVREHDGFKGVNYFNTWAKKPKDFQGGKS